MKYIDISEWQGDIDFEKVKPNVAGVIIRAGYGNGHIDKKFERNASECNRLGIPCGAYWFSYAYNPDMARREALHLLAAVKPYRMELPLAFDFEYDSVNSAAKNGVQITKALASDMARTFCTEIENGGYWALNYANPDFLNRYFDESIPQRFGLWLAQWPGGTVDVTKPPRKCAIWQWGGSEIPGITPGHTVDTNESYQDFKTIILNAGLNHLKDPTPEPEPEPEPVLVDPAPAAVEWAKEAGLIPDYIEAPMTFTWGDFALELKKLMEEAR